MDQVGIVGQIVQVRGFVGAGQRHGRNLILDLGDVAVEGVGVGAVLVVHQRAGIVGAGPGGTEAVMAPVVAFLVGTVVTM